MSAMQALDLYQLGRWLTRLGEEAMRPLDPPASPPGQRLVLMDVFTSPDSSVGEIARRTGLPQSYVSEVVARLRDAGAFATRPDPADRRRTLVSVSPALPRTVAGLGRTSVDQLLLQAFGDPPERAQELLAALEEATVRLRAVHGAPGSVTARLYDAGQTPGREPWGRGEEP